jgi:hypothetical protein
MGFKIDPAVPSPVISAIDLAQNQRFIHLPLTGADFQKVSKSQMIAEARRENALYPAHSELSDLIFLGHCGALAIDLIPNFSYKI